ncbi:MAG: hypothetical protein FJ149_08855 [Euryarchaeota archaeon]|nr:hypothetical protein [Euryarchaeota archaeon]
MRGMDLDVPPIEGRPPRAAGPEAAGKPGARAGAKDLAGPGAKATTGSAGGPAGEPPRPEPGRSGGEPLVSAETEAGRGEPVCAYGVEVVELLEMEPLEGPIALPRRRRPYHRYASAVFFAVFVLGLLNCAAVLLYYPAIPTPDELLGGTCEVSGEVRDATGAAIPNASVVVTDSTQSTFTNADGWYVLKGVPAGNHRVEAAAVGYGPMAVRVDLRPRLLHGIDFTLEKGGAGSAEDSSAPADFKVVGSSYLWAAPLLLLFSVLALVAAVLSLRPERPGRVILLGVAGALSFGFGMGFALALLGAFLAAAQLRREEGLPLKKLRVGMSYPSRRAAAPPRPGPVRDTEGPGLPAAGASGDGKPAPPSEHVHGIEEVEVYLKERSLRAKMASAEIEPAATLGRGEVDREGAPRPRRFIRRSGRTRMLCFVCVSDIGQGSEYIRCSCGRTMHVKCLHRPRCPECGCSFRKEG